MRVLTKLAFFVIISTSVCIFHSKAFGNILYVDNQLSHNCSSYNPMAGRGDSACGNGSSMAYITIQEAIRNCAVGDTIYMRGGVYREIAIDIPESKNGSSWADGQFTTLCSYPGEWAVIDGSGLNTGAEWYRQAVFTHPTGYDTRSSNKYTKYWKFERFEVTGGRSGFFLKGDHLWFRFLYIHDNGRDNGDTIQAGILMPIPKNCIIEYCHLKDNIQPTPNNNNSNILFDADYRDTADNNGNGLELDPEACIKNNVIRYNLLEGSRYSIRHKNQQRFGFNNRNPNDMKYKEWGDKIHHNIILGASQSIVVGQDFCQVYNNITDSVIDCGRNGDVPQTYNYCVYNNTVKGPGNSFFHASGYDPNMKNYYDNGSQKTVHPHIWFFNNISSGCDSGWHHLPWIICWDMPENTNNPNWDMSDLVLEHNFIHRAAQDCTVLVGHTYSDCSGCKCQDHTTAEFNNCSKNWRGAGTVVNWENDNPGLFIGDTGPEQYKTNGSFTLAGQVTIANGGKAQDHPYLDGIKIPSYIGATNPLKDSGLAWDPNNPDPNDAGWVDFVLSLSDVDNLMKESQTSRSVPSAPENLRKAD